VESAGGLKGRKALCTTGARRAGLDNAKENREKGGRYGNGERKRQIPAKSYREKNGT